MLPLMYSNYFDYGSNDHKYRTRGDERRSGDDDYSGTMLTVTQFSNDPDHLTVMLIMNARLKNRSTELVSQKKK